MYIWHPRLETGYGGRFGTQCHSMPFLLLLKSVYTMARQTHRCLESETTPLFKRKKTHSLRCLCILSHIKTNEKTKITNYHAFPNLNVWNVLCYHIYSMFLLHIQWQYNPPQTPKKVSNWVLERFELCINFLKVYSETYIE